MDNEIQLFFEKQKENVRKDSMRYVHDYIMDNNVKNFVEFGMSRISGIEGDFTILGSLLAKLKKIKFTSVDIDCETVNRMISHLKGSEYKLLQSDEGEVSLICQDQYKFMEDYDGDPFQYVFLDGGDGNKHGAFQCLLDSNILDSHALICIDDMVTWNPWSDSTYSVQTNEVVKIINEDKRLTPVNKIEYSPLNEEQEKWIKYNSENPISSNFDVYPEGVRQYEYQILVKYNKNGDEK